MALNQKDKRTIGDKLAHINGRLADAISNGDSIDLKAIIIDVKEFLDWAPKNMSLGPDELERIKQTLESYEVKASAALERLPK